MINPVSGRPELVTGLMPWSGPAPAVLDVKIDDENVLGRAMDVPGL